MYNKKNPKVAKDKFLQGDVCGMYVSSLPSSSKPIKGLVIAEGEVTGHNHVLESGTLYRDEFGNLFAKIDKPVMLLHQEHAPWILHEGIIQFGERGVMQVEYSGEEERRVLD